MSEYLSDRKIELREGLGVNRPSRRHGSKGTGVRELGSRSFTEQRLRQPRGGSVPFFAPVRGGAVFLPPSLNRSA